MNSFVVGVFFGYQKYNCEDFPPSMTSGYALSAEKSAAENGRGDTKSSDRLMKMIFNLNSDGLTGGSAPARRSAASK